MTAVGDILDEFFSPFSEEKMWVMPQTDAYTRRVRRWAPVKASVGRIRANLKQNYPNWARNYVSNPSWRPIKSDTPKVGAFRDFVRSPPGTDPTTCATAFALYVSSKVAGQLKPFHVPEIVPEIQTESLYTCAIGSFNIYATIDTIDIVNKSATVNYWMYNRMSQRSFGQFAEWKIFALCGMENQYMWWNWRETIDWSSGVISIRPDPTNESHW